MGSSTPARARAWLRQLESNLEALENMVFPDDELAAIDQHAVESGVNLWAKQTED